VRDDAWQDRGEGFDYGQKAMLDLCRRRQGVPGERGGLWRSQWDVRGGAESRLVGGSGQGRKPWKLEKTVGGALFARQREE
jgi:hypothetical protein